jgi:hypothetical protein
MYALVRSAATTTCVDASPPLIDQIARQVAPFMAVQAVEARPAGVWLVGDARAASPDGREYAIDVPGEPASHVCVSAVERSVAHLSPPGDAWLVQGLLRITRALHRVMALGSGATFLHGGLIQLGALGIALLGRSRSGKTSTGLALAQSDDAAFIANDDVSIHMGPDRLLGVGWPRSVSVRLDAVPHLWPTLTPESFCAPLTHPANATLGQLRLSGAEPNGTALVYPQELSQLFGVQVRATADVHALVFPTFDDRLESIHLRRLDRAETLARLTSLLRTPPIDFMGFLLPAVLGDRAPDSPAAFGSIADLPGFEYRQRFARLLANARELRDALDRDVVPDRTIHHAPTTSVRP